MSDRRRGFVVDIEERKGTYSSVPISARVIRKILNYSKDTFVI
ncbi:MAG: hypothetical protein WBZ36_04205 [Candidatus Nitrosopolaris sp.]